MEGRQSLSLSDSPGTVAPTGIRQCGVPGADKGISWRRSSDSGWRVCLSNNTVDTGVNAAVTPLFEFECIWHESACMCEARTARVALTLTEVKIKYARSDTSAAPWCLFWRKEKLRFLWAFPSVIKARLSSEIQDRILPPRERWMDHPSGESVGRAREGSHGSIRRSANRYTIGINLVGQAFHVWELGDMKATWCGGICPRDSM